MKVGWKKGGAGRGVCCCVGVFLALALAARPKLLPLAFAGAAWGAKPFRAGVSELVWHCPWGC